ncbi:uncharacterized protein B0H18DRAFT_1047432, partial [Fomitopsis serialis]|uniref:uncharacterized protein n=1 Tax=Fomitopsis serialis TaxID=139415 RepID=UPI002007F830
MRLTTALLATVTLLCTVFVAQAVPLTPARHDAIACARLIDCDSCGTSSLAWLPPNCHSQSRLLQSAQVVVGSHSTRKPVKRRRTTPGSLRHLRLNARRRPR